MAGKSTDILRIGDNTHERVVGASRFPLASFEIGLAGLSDACWGFHFARADPKFVQVLACVDGEGEVLVDGAWRRCGPGQAYITPARASHGYRAIPDSRWRLAWVQFSPVTISLDRPPMVKEADPQPLELAILGLYRESHGVMATDVMASWAHLINTFARRILDEAFHDVRLASLWETVGEDLRRPWSLKEMAQRAHMSPEHLRRLCNLRFGRSPLRQVTHMRLRRGGELLWTTDRKIAVVARQVGYESTFAFSAAFKREFGMSPSEHREKLARPDSYAGN